MNLKLDTPLSLLPKTHSSTIKRYDFIGIKNFGDLLGYLPRRYVDYSISSPIGSVQPGETVTLKGNVKIAKNRFVRRNLSIQEIVITDNTGEITAYWYNQPYLIKQFEREGVVLACAGEIEKKGKKLVIKPDEYEILMESQIGKLTGKIIPIYLEKLHISSRTTREKIALILEMVDKNSFSEWLPSEIVHHLIVS